MSATQTDPNYIPRFRMVPRRNLLGAIIPGAFRMFWGGRKPSKYLPHVGKKQLARQCAAS